MPKTDDPKSTREALARIEQTLDALCAEVGGLGERVDRLSEGAASKGQMTTSQIIKFLDGYRAAEAMADAALGAWIAVSDTPCLRGGLRAVQMREGAHAQLFEQRIKELGGSPRAQVDADTEELYMAFGNTDRSDPEKIDAFMKAAGDPKVIEQLEAQAARMNGDEETQFLLRCVIEDERASLGFLAQAHELLCGR